MMRPTRRRCGLKISRPARAVVACSWAASTTIQRSADTRHLRAGVLVDNPWSVAGRGAGLRQQLAQFCVGLSEPLDGWSKQSFLRKGPTCRRSAWCASCRGLVATFRSWSRFVVPIGTRRTIHQCGFLRVSAESVLPWAQSDFKLPEFRRSFAHAVVGDGFLYFSSIQAVPVDSRDLPGAWITGHFSLSDCEVAFPAGIATLAFTAPDKLPPGDDVPEAWRTLCGLLHKQPIALPTGEWYRLKCSMDFQVDDLLDP